jgi:hypothetical protein
VDFDFFFLEKDIAVGKGIAIIARVATRRIAFAMAETHHLTVKLSRAA